MSCFYNTKNPLLIPIRFENLLGAAKEAPKRGTKTKQVPKRLVLKIQNILPFWKPSVLRPLWVLPNNTCVVLRNFRVSDIISVIFLISRIFGAIVDMFSKLISASKYQDQLVTASRGASQKVSGIGQGTLRDHYLTVTASSPKKFTKATYSSGRLLSSLPSHWNLSPLLSLPSSRFCFALWPDSRGSPVPRQLYLLCSSVPFCQVTTTSTTTQPTVNHIISSSGEERPHWSSKLREKSDIKMFTNDPKLNPRLPSPTSFDGVKPSYVEWSEELLT